MLTTTFKSSGDNSRISNGDGVARPAWPERKIRPEGCSPLSKSRTVRHHRNLCPCTIEKTLSHSDDDDDDDEPFVFCTRSFIGEYHEAFQRRRSRETRLSAACFSLSWAPFRRLSQKYVFLKSSSVGRPRIALEIQTINGFSSVSTLAELGRSEANGFLLGSLFDENKSPYRSKKVAAYWPYQNSQSGS